MEPTIFSWILTFQTVTMICIKYDVIVVLNHIVRVEIIP
jgi:hypothetical protein